MSSYRKIYEQNYGSIPEDKDGRTYEVHHIDGNHNNNSPENLIAVTIQEHYDLHYAHGDWAACQAIAMRMIISPGELSDLARKNAQKRIANGTHNFLDGENARINAQKRIANGTHNLQIRTDGTSLSSDRVLARTHNFLQRPDGSSISKDRIKKATHNF